MGILLKLHSIQQSLSAPKDEYNEFGKYKYRSCEGILKELKKHLGLNGMDIILSDCVVEIGGRVYIEATATLYDVETGETISSTAYAREEEQKKGMDTSQVTGAASSYARKYALNGLFAIDDTKDSDFTNDQSAKNAPDGAFYCDECLNEIKSRKIGGTLYSPSQIAHRGLEKHGKQLCWDCQKKHEMPSD